MKLCWMRRYYIIISGADQNRELGMVRGKGVWIYSMYATKKRLENMMVALAWKWVALEGFIIGLEIFNKQTNEVWRELEMEAQGVESHLVTWSKWLMNKKPNMRQRWWPKALCLRLPKMRRFLGLPFLLAF